MQTNPLKVREPHQSRDKNKSQGGVCDRWLSWACSRASREILTILEIPLARSTLRLLPKYAWIIVFKDLGEMHFSPGAFENNTSSRRSEMRETRILPGAWTPFVSSLNRLLTVYASLNFIRLLRVVLSSQQLRESITRSTRNKADSIIWAVRGHAWLLATPRKGELAWIARNSH